MSKQKQSIKYKYDRNRALSLLMDASAYGDWSKAEANVKNTETFINSAFDDYEGKNRVDSVDFAFCIPTRASRFSEEYWQEVYDFLPGLKHLPIQYRFAILSSIPPFKIVTYGKPGTPSHGAVIFVPIFNDMLKDYRNKLLLKREVNKRINDMAYFAHERMGAGIIGLGATLPKLTNFGRTIKANVATTTGHAGTAWLMYQTFNEVLDKYFNSTKRSLKIGFIGAGSIGVAALEIIATNNRGFEYQIFDIRQKMNEAAQQKMQMYDIEVIVSKSNQSLIKDCDIVMSAVTSKIDVSGMALAGKVIVDDSQPGQFSREEVQAAGGVLVWVVGKDNSAGRFATRRNGYSYGPNGLHGPEDLWGCEAEVAAIANVGEYGLAVRNHVTIEQIEGIGKVFEELNIEIADFQSHGQIND